MRPMELKKGIAVSPGIVIREAFILDSEEIRIPERFIEKEQIEEESARLEAAIAESENRLDQDIAQLGSKIQINTQILEIHRQLVGDAVLKNEILIGIQENQYTAEHSVSRVLNKYIKKFERMDSQIISERVHDLYDVEKLILTTLLGSRVEHLDSLEREVVLVARNLTPAQTAKLDATWVKGFATDIGGKTSHTAIMAKALGIPAVVGLENISTTVVGGDTLIIDGFRGVVLINPDARTLADYRDKEANLVKLRQRLRKDVALPSETVDGYPIELFANIELIKEVHALANLNTAGIGLFRTEFIHLQNPRSGEEGHFQHYQATLKEIGQLPVTFRTLDLGADKGDGGRGPWVEENPFLGCRSIRYCFEHPDLFRDQLRALLRASAHGSVRIMLPMVGAIAELDRALNMLDQVKEDLRNDGIAFDENVPVGVMVEIPSLAMIADLIAPRVDFFSVGTNDLTQYTLAVDRGNENVASLFDPGHPAVLRLLQQTLRAGEAAGIPVSLCGEMGSEPLYVPLLIGLGFRNLSVSPTSIPEVKRLIRTIKVYECKALAKRCLAHTDGLAITAELKDWVSDKLPPSMRF
ncbi:MAG: phosphoenolpyruvate--protein phosphotransferase [Planctomycetota bacterium]